MPLQAAMQRRAAAMWNWLLAATRAIARRQRRVVPKGRPPRCPSEPSSAGFFRTVVRSWT